MSVGADSRIGTELAGYRIERLLGRGEMSVVYLAYDPGLDRRVALKLISPELSEDESFRNRFRIEWRRAASIEHPNVVPVYDAGEADGQLYIAMRWTKVPHNESIFGGSQGTEASDVAAGESGLLVAVGPTGRFGEDEDSDAAVWTSSDGVSWTRVLDEGLATPVWQAMQGVTAIPTGFIAVGNELPVGADLAPEHLDAAVWRSRDGTSWEQVSGNEEAFGGPGGQSIQEVVVAGPGFVAVGVDAGPEFSARGGVWISPDGISWSRVSADQEIFASQAPGEIQVMVIWGGRGGRERTRCGGRTRFGGHRGRVIRKRRGLGLRRRSLLDTR